MRLELTRREGNVAFNKNKVMEAARRFVEKGQHDKAIKEYLRVVKEDPKDVRIWLKIGDLYAKKGAKQEATETYLKVARFYSEQGFYLKAVAVYKQILKLDPRLVEVNLKLAELYRQLGLLSDAMQHFEMVAAHFHREGKTKEALATVRQLVDLDPDNVATRIKLAELYSKEQMTQEAIAEFAQACEYLRAQNRQDDFVKVAERLLWHQPDNIDLSRELATLYLRRSDPRRALQKLQTCFKANARDIETLALLAQAFQALDQKTKTVSVLKELARVLHEDNQRDKAAEVHRKILVYVPQDADALAYLGLDRAEVDAPGPAKRLAITSSDLPQVSRAGQPTGSVPLLRQESPAPVEATFDDVAVEEVDEEDSSFVADLQFEDESSFAESSRAGETHSDEINKILTETDVYVKYGLHQKASEHLRRIFELDPDNVEARERLKTIYLSQGREEDAIAELMQLAELTASVHPGAAEDYLREVLSVDSSHQPAFEMARRFRLDLTASPELEMVDELSDGAILLDNGTGETTPVEEDDHLDFAGTGPAPQSRYSDVFEAVASFDLELPDGETGAEIEERSGITMEVSVDQVEDMVELEDAVELIEDLELDGNLATTGEATSELGTAERYDYSYESDLPPAVASPDYELDFDPDDAAAFDADIEPGQARQMDSLERDGAAAAAADDEDELAGTYEGPAQSWLEAQSDADGFHPQETIPGEGGWGGGATDVGRMPGDLDSSAAGVSLEDDLDEADFFINQRLYPEAQDILRSLLQRYPSHPLVMAKLADVEAMADAEDPDLGGLDEALESIGHDDSGIEPRVSVAAESPSKPAVLLEKPIEDEDAETHYDLGLAYKEMGLYGEAIKAFEKVAQLPGREVQCRSMIGLCHREQGNLSEAVHHFKSALHAGSIIEREKLNLFYEIGASYEAIGDTSEALYYFELVLKKDESFRDVTDRLDALAAKVGADTRRNPAGPEDADAAIDSLLAEETGGRRR